MQLNILSFTLVTLIATTGLAMAEEDSPLSFNVGIVSHYLARGVSQSANHAAVQGGIDYGHSSGFFLGTWASTIDFSGTGNPDPVDRPRYEWDIYAGFGKTMGDFGYNIQLTYYTYPDENADNWNYSELGVSGTWKILTIGMEYTWMGEPPTGQPYREGDLYYYGKLSYGLPMDIKLSGTLGYYDFDVSDTTNTKFDYTHWQIALSRDFGLFGSFSISYDQNNGGAGHFVAFDDDAKFSVGWKKTF